jgi:pilus assembly protein CpaB
MKPGVIVIIVAVLAAGMAAMLAKVWLDRQSAAPRSEAPPSIEVMVMARNVAAGTALQVDDLRYENWPVSLSSPRLTLREGVADGRTAFAGQIARRALNEGEPFTAEATAKRENAGLMAAMLSPGMRAVSIAISNPTDVSGFITPGDKVDVVVAADLARAVEGERPPPSDRLLRYSAETVLTDVRVLAIDQQYARNPDGGAVQGKTATIEVTPKQVEILTVAGLLGSLQLVLHGKDDGDSVPPHSFSGDVEISAGLRNLLAGRPVATGGTVLRFHGPVVLVNRAGAVSTEEFAK